MFGGFWGTAREDAWHRRKLRYYEREDQKRMEEKRRLDNVAAHHQKEMNQKDRILDLTKRMLNSARYDAASTANKKRRMEASASAPTTAENDASNSALNEKMTAVR
jgi:hypothetical protein